MKDRPKPSASAKIGQYVLTSKRGEKFSEVEGLKLSQRMYTVVREASSGRFMTGDERRTLVKDAIRILPLE